MQTFMPYPDYSLTAATLDTKRLGKQRVEAFQILRVRMGLTQGWKNHPAVLMWEGHEGSLCDYGIAMCEEWIRRGHQDHLLPQFIYYSEYWNKDKFSLPWWLDNPTFHMSHRSNLKRKDPIHYNFQDVLDDLPYQWPVMETQTFRIIEKKVAKNGNKIKV